jgi:MoaA/NifB/PqqE/SkfB family radical SAM enzyme
MNVPRKLAKLREMTKLFIFGLPKFAVGSIDVTNRCNLRCEHCYFFAEVHDNERDLSIE